MGFPVVNINYSLCNFTSLKKLEVFIGGQSLTDLHIVMTGSQNGKDGVVVDEVRTAPGVFVEYTSTIFPQEHIFDDVTITNNYINVSFRQDLGISFVSGGVVFIPKPTTIGTTIFSSTASYRRVHDFLLSSILLESCSEDASVAVFLANESSSGKPLVVKAFTNGHVHYATTKTYPLPLQYPTDVKYNRDSKELDVLANYLILSLSSPNSDDEIDVDMDNIDISAALGSRIYHYITTNQIPVYSVSCHEFSEETLSSLDYLHNAPDNYITSGHANGLYTPRLCKYHYNQWRQCTEVSSLKSYGADTDLNEILSITPVYDTNTVNLGALYSSEKIVPITVICNSENQQE